jgi:phage shock protein A
MGFRKRIGVIVRSQLGDWVIRAEDPQKILTQAVEDMEEGLEKARARMALLKFGIEEREKVAGRIVEQAGLWQERAEEYVRKGMDENAREAVRRRRALVEKKRRLDMEQSREEATLKEFEKKYSELESRVQAAKSKKALLLKDISMRRGDISSDESGAFAGFRSDETFTVFRKMEERVEGERADFTSTQEKEREEKLIDEEIAALKKEIGKGGGKK